LKHDKDLTLFFPNIILLDIRSAMLLFYKQLAFEHSPFCIMLSSNSCKSALRSAVMLKNISTTYSVPTYYCYIIWQLLIVSWIYKYICILMLFWKIWTCCYQEQKLKLMACLIIYPYQFFWTKILTQKKLKYLFHWIHIPCIKR